MFTKKEIALAPKVIEAIKRISKGKWEWEPEIYDFVYYKNPDTKQEGVGVVSWIDEKFKNSCSKDSIVHYINVLEGGPAHSWPKEYLTPLLHWERIRSILQNWGYTVKIGYSEEFAYACRILRLAEPYAYVAIDTCNDWQEAVQRAVIELGEKKEEK